MRRSILSLIAIFCATAAPAQNGMVWQAYHGGASPGRAGVELFFGVPRSGDLLLSGSCDISGPTPFVPMTIFTGDLPFARGATVTVTLTGTAQQAVTFTARNDGYDDFSGLTIVQTNLALDDSAWQLFASSASVTYAVQGGPPITISGDPQPIQDFLATCAARGGPTCEVARPSTDTGESLALTVTNSSRGARGIVWLAPDGTPTEIGRLETGQSGTLDTDAGHVWMFTDDQGRCVEMRQGGLSRAGIELFQPGPN